MSPPYFKCIHFKLTAPEILLCINKEGGYKSHKMQFYEKTDKICSCLVIALYIHDSWFYVNENIFRVMHNYI